MLPAPASRPFQTELRATLRLAGPLALANLLQMTVYATDVMFVARLGQEALAASSLAVAIIAVLMMGLNGVTGAVAPLIAAEIGRRSNAVREVRRSVRMALWMAVGGGLACIGLCQFSVAFMLATGQEPELATRGGDFLAILSVSMVPMAVANVLRTFVSALGRPIFATVITAASILINVVGDYALVFGHFGAPALGLTGAALASIITASSTVIAYAVAIAGDRNLRRFHVFGRWWRPEWQRMRQMLALGLPISATLVAEGGLFSGAAFVMGHVGEAQLAAHTVALQIAAFAFQVPFGVGQAATIRVGYHFGSGNREGVGHAGWAAIAIGMAFMVLSALAMLAMPGLILSAYMDVSAPGNAVMIGYALSYLFIAAIFQLVDGLQAVAAGVLRGVQDARVPMFFALIGYWLAGFGTSLVLGLFTPLGGVGVWIGLAVGLTVAAALLVARWHWRDRFGLVPQPAA
ncbi:MATE family efflux transporter [Novosphingobium mangrovi (ex Huang et al. 2023)]|uniref:Multidrug-efflux transporter n=1 Tax=Novosphingobium mangrovi (ex Huang et al. 2023) TaxID=2976432 RepID=A0ABT2I2R7_9SPHN|nr:MATE family efflux transporter [Novosphingobium mangrovi (ex Huang et al. 2023)]MCT2399091.1 MATE family efflux transporter [Novosphingobium mangrovi (ex Huang et al. 2023)]